MNHAPTLLRLCLAALLTGAVIAALGWGIARQRSRLTEALAGDLRARAALAAETARAAEFAPGGPGYRRYAGLAAQGTFASPDPARLKARLRRLAEESGIAPPRIGVSTPLEQPVTGATGLILDQAAVTLRVKAASDGAVYSFLDRLPRAGLGLFALDSLSLDRAEGGVGADIRLRWAVIEGAPPAEAEADDVAATPLLADGVELFPATAADAAPGNGDGLAQPAPASSSPMIVRVERAEK